MRLGFLFITIFSFSIALSQESECENIVKWTYKDITKKNIKKSYELIQKKLSLSILTSLKNTKTENLKRHPELLQHYKSLKNSAGFKQLILEYKPLKRYKFWYGRRYKKVKPINYKEAITSIIQLQKKNFQYFKGMKESELFNKWDLYTLELVSKKHNISDQNYAKMFRELNSKYSNAHYDISQKSINVLKNEIDEIQKLLLKNSHESYQNIFTNYEKVCSKSQLDKYYQSIGLSCPFKEDPFINLNKNLNELSIVLSQFNSFNTKKPIIKEEPPIIIPPKVDPVDELEIVNHDYIKTNHKNSYFCKRDINALNSITIHHTATNETDTAIDINNLHRERLDNGVPWYMVGYHYLISDLNTNKPTVNQGRPLEYQGAHAGGDTAPLAYSEYKRIKNLKYTCAKSELQHQSAPKYSIKRRLSDQRQITGNITSVGIALIGDFEAYQKVTIAGVITIRHINRKDKAKRASNEALKEVGLLACKLQRQTPSIKTLHPHSYFKPTNCPGSIIADLKKIANYAKEQGCDFKVVYRKK
ncbi:MAG: peptidoglycan recognition protein family protein [Bacteriovoracaceae bacterium]|jgi:hypothetical protein|nr:peptidoglycan recognition protein family protein [Bacteriovoracaceae bacterium]